MSLLDHIDEQMARGDRWAERMPVLTEKREHIISELLVPVSANRVVTTRNLPQIIIEAVNDPFYKHLSHLKGCEVVSLDCHIRPSAAAILVVSFVVLLAIKL